MLSEQTLMKPRAVYSPVAHTSSPSLHHPADYTALCGFIHPRRHAVRIAAASCSPSSSMVAWRMMNFWILPVTVIGKASTNFQ